MSKWSTSILRYVFLVCVCVCLYFHSNLKIYPTFYSPTNLTKLLFRWFATWLIGWHASRTSKRILQNFFFISGNGYRSNNDINSNNNNDKSDYRKEKCVLSFLFVLLNKKLSVEKSQNNYNWSIRTLLMMTSPHYLLLTFLSCFSFNGSFTLWNFSTLRHVQIHACYIFTIIYWSDVSSEIFWESF